VNMVFIKHWKVAGALVKPKCITRNLKEPYQVWKVVFHLSPGVVGTIELNFSEDAGFVKMAQEVQDEWKWTAVFHHDSVKAVPVDTKAKGSILLDKEDGSATGRLQGPDEVMHKVLLKKFPKGSRLDFRKIVNWTKGWSFTSFEFDMMAIEQIMIGEFVDFALSKDAKKVMILRRNFSA